MQESGESSQLMVRDKRVHKMTGHTRDRRGCMSCRRRKKKCEGDASSTGICGQCERLNIHCEWEVPRDTKEYRVRVKSNAVAKAQLPRAPNPQQFWTEASKDARYPDGINKRLGMKYYLGAFASMISTTQENNGFLTVLVPMSTESSPLYNSMVAWSSSHLALWQPELEVRAMQDRDRAYSSFRSALPETGTAECETTLAACLVHVSMDTILGDTEQWFNHLGAAAMFIESTMVQDADGKRISSLEHCSDGRWLLKNFAYHDILASITLCQAMLVPDLGWFKEEEQEVADNYFGLGSIPMKALAEISIAAEQLRKTSEVVVYDVEVDESPAVQQEYAAIRLRTIEKQLKRWVLQRSHDIALTQLAGAYKSAALVYLYRTQRQFYIADTDGLEEKIKREVKAVLRHAEQMPEACLPECTLLFPLFLAGGETRDADQQAFVRGRMVEMIKHRRFQNVSTALDVLEEVWDVRTRTTPVDPNRPYDWTDVLKRRNWKLAIS